MFSFGVDDCVGIECSDIEAELTRWEGVYKSNRSSEKKSDSPARSWRSL